MLFLLLSARFSTDAGPAAASREEADAAWNSCPRSSCGAESRAASARTDHCTAEGDGMYTQFYTCCTPPYSYHCAILHSVTVQLLQITAFILIVLFFKDCRPASHSASRPASPAATAEGDVCPHPTLTGTQDPILCYYIHCPVSEACRSPTNPGTSPVTITK